MTVADYDVVCRDVKVGEWTGKSSPIWTISYVTRTHFRAAMDYPLISHRGTILALHMSAGDSFETLHFACALRYVRPSQ